VRTAVKTDANSGSTNSPENRAFSAILRANAGAEPASGQLASSLGEIVLFYASLGTMKKTEENRGHSQITAQLSS
jgi:hypothetical protein